MRFQWILLLQSVAAFDILFHVTLIGKSHLTFANNLIELLVERGHNVDIVMGILNENVDPSKVSPVTRRWMCYGFPPGENIYGTSAHLAGPFDAPPRSNRLEFFYQVENDLCAEGLNSSSLSRWIDERQYDIGVSSGYGICGAAMFHKHSIPSSALYIPTPLMMHNAHQLGLPSPSGYVVDWVLGRSHAPSTFLERMDNLLNTLAFHLISVPKNNRQTDWMLRSLYGPSFPSARQLVDHAAVVFVNSNELMHLTRPITHKVKFIGGIGHRSPQPLSAHLDRLLDSRANGAVLFSFGTQVPTAKIPIRVRKMFAAAFAHFPGYTFLWKYDNLEDDAVSFSANTHPLEWLPQNDLLHDDRVKLFISHMGMNSLNEGTHAGVPFVGVPLFLDQPANTIVARQRGIAVALDKLALTEHTIVEAIREVLNNESYREESARLAAMLREKPDQPRRQFVEWVEYAAAYPSLGCHLNLPSVHLSVVEEYCLDCFALIAVCLLTVVYTVYCVLTRLVRFVGDKKVKVH